MAVTYAGVPSGLILHIGQRILVSGHTRPHSGHFHDFWSCFGLYDSASSPKFPLQSQHWTPQGSSDNGNTGKQKIWK
jgi:hypothetical protein